MRLIYGVGYNSGGKHGSCNELGKKAKIYAIWQGMLKRCYDPKQLQKQPTYIGCSVSEHWHDYQDFAEWYKSHECGDLSYDLDKDLLIPNNKVYSPESCVLVPQELNKILINCGKAKDGSLRGVSFHKRDKRYQSSLRTHNGRRHLGSFDCPDEAYQVYKEAKESYVKERALYWRDRIEAKAFEALMNWQLAE